MTVKPALHVLLAGPRGFCAGVDRAIKIVEEALLRFGQPVYVRHEIVHNKFVVQNLEAKGAIFVEELDEVPPDAPVVFSAHGVPKSVPAEARRREMVYLDATCPLVSKVHREAERHAAHLLRTYRRSAALVITPLHHAATPCIASGVPVVIARATDDPRFSFLRELTPVYLPEDFARINWAPRPVDIAPVRDKLVEHVRQGLDGAGLLPLQPPARPNLPHAAAAARLGA